MLPIEEVTLGCSYEELTPIRAWTGVCLEDVEMRKTTTRGTVPSTGDLRPYASLGSFRPNKMLSTPHHRHRVATNREVLPVYREGASTIAVYEVTTCRRMG